MNQNWWLHSNSFGLAFAIAIVSLLTCTHVSVSHPSSVSVAAALANPIMITDSYVYAETTDSPSPHESSDNQSHCLSALASRGHTCDDSFFSAYVCACSPDLRVCECSMTELTAVGIAIVSLSALSLLSACLACCFHCTFCPWYRFRQRHSHTRVLSESVDFRYRQPLLPTSASPVYMSEERSPHRSPHRSAPRFIPRSPLVRILPVVAPPPPPSNSHVHVVHSSSSASFSPKASTDVQVRVAAGVSYADLVNKYVTPDIHSRYLTVTGSAPPGSGYRSAAHEHEHARSAQWHTHAHTRTPQSTTDAALPTTSTSP